MPETGRAEPEGAGSPPKSAPSTPKQPSSRNATTPKRADGMEQQDFANPTLNIIHSLSRSTSTSQLSSRSREETPPPLPPRPQLRAERPSTSHSLRKAPSRPQLVSKATTQLSLSTGQAFSDARIPSQSTSDADDSASIKSFLPAETVGDGESILGEIMGPQERSETEKTLLQSLGHRFEDAQAQTMFAPDPWFDAAYNVEFDEIEEMKADGSNEEAVMKQWRAKLKHFLILSSAGKPIYSRHGDDQLVTNYIGVVQTIISFYQSTKDSLRGFTAGDVRFVVMSKGPLNLVAITRLPESDSQLRSQLEALYMQILSTLTLPSMERMFAARANYDLRRPLQGTETLLSALSDGFMRGSPSTLLSALECLKLRKSHRNTINNAFLKTRSENLLYGLVVASAKLVSVVRPKKHSLHPGDLLLIFNMLFEAGSVKAGGGENWIPLCLPGFNNTGYLYMYVSFLDLERPAEHVQERPGTRDGADDEVAVVLISAEKEGFFEMRHMRDELVEQLQRTASMDAIRAAVELGRPKCTDIVPGSPLRHFLYKSRGNVQFVMPAFEPYFGRSGGLERRRLLNLYHHLHANIHAKPTSLKIHHETSTTYIAIAWSTPLFELYAVAPPSTSRIALAQAANRVVQWVRREEERVFIIGGAVF